jgi:hypothetical protein
VSGTLIAIAAFIPMYFLIANYEGKSREINVVQLGIALLIPLVASALVAFSSPIIESAGIRGWLSVVAHIVVMYFTLRKIVDLPTSRAAAYTVIGVILNTVLQTIWYYWLIDVVGN